MQQLGAALIFALPKRCLLTLSGELGAGKSVLARAMIHAAGFTGRVKSPTYTLVETYEIESPRRDIVNIAHFDLYRLADADELHYLGFDDILEQSDLVLIEWPSRADQVLRSATVRVNIEYTEDGGRRVAIESPFEIDLRISFQKNDSQVKN